MANRSFSQNMAYYKPGQERLKAHINSLPMQQPCSAATSKNSYGETRKLASNVTSKLINEVQGILAINEERVLQACEREIQRKQEDTVRLTKLNKAQQNTIFNLRKKSNKQNMELHFARETIAGLKKSNSSFKQQVHDLKAQIDNLEMDVKFCRVSHNV